MSQGSTAFVFSGGCTAKSEGTHGAFVDALARRPVQTGTFGADMQVSSVNDGPFTLVLESTLKRPQNAERR